MTSVHELRSLHPFVSHKKMLKPFLIYGPNGLGKVSEIFFIFQIHLLRLKVRYDPREYWVLRKVAERSVSCLIEVHEVIKIRDLFILPEHCDILQLINFNALPWNSFGKYSIYSVPVVLVVKGKVIRFIRNNLQADLI